MPRAAISISDHNFSLLITGDPILGFDEFTFNTNLTILALTLDLHNSLILQGDLHSVNFMMLVYGQLLYWAL